MKFLNWLIIIAVFLALFSGYTIGHINGFSDGYFKGYEKGETWDSGYSNGYVRGFEDGTLFPIFSKYTYEYHYNNSVWLNVTGDSAEKSYNKLIDNIRR